MEVMLLKDFVPNAGKHTKKWTRRSDLKSMDVLHSLEIFSITIILSEIFFLISIFKFLNQVLKLCSHDTFSAVQKVAIQARLDDIAEKEKQRLDSIKRAVDLVAAWKAE